MAIYGVYTEEEKRMLADFAKDADTRVGWAKSLPRRVATEEAMLSMAYHLDPWNTLWRDENYAAGTRWGGLIAFPIFYDCFKPPIGIPEVPPSAGFRHFVWIGEDWEWFQPVRVNDSFKVWRRREQLVDATSLDGKGPRKFKFLNLDADIINQKDELASTTKFYIEIIILPGPPKPYPMPEYGYTMEEQDFIDRIMSEEEIRGANIRYWEEVSIGEETKPIVLGPTSMETVANVTGVSRITGNIHPRRLRKYEKPTGAPVMGTFLKDPATGLLYTNAGRHMSDRAAQAEGEPRAFLFAKTSRHAMIRLVTNWMGDDGFIKKFHWRHIARNPIGDTLFGHGKVTNKRVENGEHLVDLAVWLENLRGNITEAAAVTVSLCSKEVPFIWK